MASEASTTSYDVTVAHFTRSRRAAEWHARWSAKPEKAPVVAMAQQLDSRGLYGVSPSDVMRIAKLTRHALSRPDRWPEDHGLRSSIGRSVAEVVNWFPNFPLVHSFYFAIEDGAGLPTWQDFIRLMKDPAKPVKTMLYDPAHELVTGLQSRGCSGAAEAMWWRLGNMYYSMLREVWVLSILRDLGYDVRYHVLADAGFRADYWLGDKVISLYVTNREYRDVHGAGRKITAREWLGDFSGFSFAQMPRYPMHTYGKVHLPQREEVEAWASSNLP